MKRIKKSIKIIISLGCVFLLAVAGVVTAILVNNSKNNPNSPGSGYTLTAGQKLLVSEINSTVSTSVSSSQRDLVEYTYSSIGISDANFYNDSIAWKTSTKFGSSLFDFQTVYDIYVINADGSETKFDDKLASENLFEDNYSYSIYYADKNFIVLDVTYEDNSTEFAVICVENHEISLVKTIAYTYNSDTKKMYTADDKLLKVSFGLNFFVVLEHDGVDYNYKLYEYKNNYSDYSPYSYPSSGYLAENDLDKIASSEMNKFYLNETIEDNNYVVYYDYSKGFVETGTEFNNTIKLKNATIEEVKTESTSSDSKAVLIDGKYYTFSYKFTKNGGEAQTLDLGDFDKLSESVVYNSEKYFAVLMRKVSENKEVEAGQIVYFDYDLNVIAKYSASSSQEKIEYSDGSAILTRKGLYLTKNSVTLTKSYDFDENNYQFVETLPNGNFLLKDDNDNICVLNFGLGTVFNSCIDEICVYLADDKLVYKTYGNYYLYNLKTNTSSEFDFDSDYLNFTSSTGLYFVKTSDDPVRYSLYGLDSVVENITNIDYNRENDSIVLNIKTQNDSGESEIVTKSFVLSEISSSSAVSSFLTGDVVSASISNVSGSVENTGFGSSTDNDVDETYIGTDYENFGNFTTDVIDSSSRDVVGNDYNDYIQKYTDLSSTLTFYNDDDSTYTRDRNVYKITHFITDGNYSKTGYWDSPFVNYLQLDYNYVRASDKNSSYSGITKSTYTPFRIYYQVDIENGSPVLKIGDVGHIYVGTNGNNDYGINVAGETSILKSVYYKEKSYSLDYLNKLNGTVYPTASNIPNKYSYDQYVDFGNNISYYYWFAGNGIDSKLNLGVKIYTSGDSLSYHGGIGLYSSAFVSGESIAVSFIIEIYDAADYIKFNKWEFGQNEIKSTPYLGSNSTEYYGAKSYNVNIPINSYYYQLYYKTVVVGVSDKNKNIDTDLINNQSFKMLTQSSLNEITSKTVPSGSNCLETALSGNWSGYFATLSGKITLNEKANLYIGSSLAIDIVGGTFIGLTTLADTIVKDNSILYDKDLRTYKSNALKYRARGDYVDALCSLCRSKDSGEYYMSFYDTSLVVDCESNVEEIYCPLKLNTVRVVYCLYEPQTFSLQLDYNVNDLNVENNTSVGLEAEVDYLQNYAGLSIGNSYRSLSSYTDTWVYRKFDNKNEFIASTDYDHKYEPRKFTDNTTRYADADDLMEKTVSIDTFTGEGYILKYFIVDGIKYYFSYADEDHTQDSSNGSYVVAYKKPFSGLKVDLGKKSNRSVSSNLSNYNSLCYKSIDDESFVIYLKSNTQITYKTKNVNTRSADYQGHYIFYADTDNPSEINGWSDKDKNNNYIRETFTFKYNDTVKLMSNPVHSHYDFVGWRLYYTDTDYILIDAFKITKNASGLNINPYLNLINYLAGNSGVSNWRDYFSSWGESATYSASSDDIFWNCQYTYNSDGSFNTYFKNNTIRLVAEWEPKACTIEAVIWTQSALNQPHNSLKYDSVNSTFITGYSISSASVVPALFAGSENIDAKGDNKIDGKMTYVTFKYEKDKTFAVIGGELELKGLMKGGIQSNNINSRFAGWAFKDLNEDKYYSMMSDISDEMAQNTTIRDYIHDTSQITIYAYFLPSVYNFNLNLNPLGGGQETEQYKDYTQKLENNEVEDKIYNKNSAGAIYKIDVSKADNIGQYLYCTEDLDGFNYVPINSYNYYNVAVNNKFYVEDSLTINVVMADGFNVNATSSTPSQMYYVKKFVISNLTVMDSHKKYHKCTYMIEYKVTISGTEALLSWVVDWESDTLTEEVDYDEYFTFSTDDKNNLIIKFASLNHPGKISTEGGNQFFSGEDGFNLEITCDSYTIINESVSITIDEEDDRDTIFKYNHATLTATQSIANVEGKKIVEGQKPYAWIGGYKYLLSGEGWAGTMLSGYYNLHANLTATYNSSYKYYTFINQTLTPGGDLTVYYDDNTKLVHYPVSITNETNTNSSELKIDYNNTRVLVIDPEQTNNYLSADPSSFQSMDSVYELKYYLSSLTIGEYSFSFYPISRQVLQDGSRLTYDYMELNYSSSGATGEEEYITRIFGDEYSKNYWTYSFFGEKYVINDAYKIDLKTSVSKEIKGSRVYYLYFGRTSTGNSKYFLIYDECPEDYKVDYDDGKHLSINLTFKRQQNTLLIEATEKDLYRDNANQNVCDSFVLQYSRDLGLVSGSTDDEYGFDYYNFSSSIFDNLEESDIARYTLYRDKRAGLDGGNLLDNSYIRTWSSTTKFYPSETFRFRLNATSGFIIDSIKIYVGKFAYTDYNGVDHEDEFRNIISFEIDTDISFENLAYFSSGGNYSYSVIQDDILKSKIVYKIVRNLAEGEVAGDTTLGYDFYTSANKLGLLYSDHKSAEWRYDDTDTFSLDQIYLLLGGMYEDVKIEFSTTSFSEWLFENGDTTKANPLIKENISGTDAVDINFNQTYLNVYVSQIDENGIESFINITDDSLKVLRQPSIPDEVVDPSVDENWISPYILRYYPAGTVNGGLMSGTIRLMFYGVGSKIVNGLKIFATEDEHSSYFSNARYYNEKSNDDYSANNIDAFINLEDYAGRTKDNNKIIPKINAVDSHNQKKDNRLVYMTTPKLTNSFTSFYEGVDNSYFKASFVRDSIGLKPNQESNFKYFIAVTTYTNTITVETSSYLFNDTLRNDYHDTINSTSYTNYFGNASSGYSFVSDKILTTNESSVKKLYQLDDKSKSKSWFNDVILSNIQYNSYLDSESSPKKTWVNRKNLDLNTQVSEISSIEMSGLNFNWQYYEIAGYYLNSIIIYIEDIGIYYMINVYEALQNVRYGNIVYSETGATLIKTIEIPSDVKGYNYKFNLFYEVVESDGNTAGCFKLYPVALNSNEDDELRESNDSDADIPNYINWVDSLSILSNNIKVAFLSDAYSYKINYMTYEEEMKNSISTFSDALTNGTISHNYTQYTTIYYDSMTMLEYNQSMKGYTFVGWGSEKYFNKTNNTYQSRFVSGETDAYGNKSASTWNTSSSWFDVATSFFVNENVSALESALNFYKLFDLYKTYVDALPGTAFYTPNSYFMTDTGYTSGSAIQNYNFYSEYISIFGKYIGGGFQSYTPWNAGANFELEEINLYGLFRANTYAVLFDPNNSKGDDFKINYRYQSGGWLVDEFVGDKINFRTVEYDGGEKNYYYTGYVTFDTNIWYFLRRDTENQQQFSVANGPYTQESMIYHPSEFSKFSGFSSLAIDMYGYSWLGWYYKQLDDINQGESFDYSSGIFSSYYGFKNSVTSNFSATLPTFNYSFMDKGVNYTTVETPEVSYYGEHKVTDSGVDLKDGYIYFYDYSNNNYNTIRSFDYTCSFDYLVTEDYLNTFLYTLTGDSYTIEYEKSSNNAVLLSYFDTCFSKSCYSIVVRDSKYYLTLNRDYQNLRNVKLYAAWSQNQYTTIYDMLDCADGKVESVGSSPVEWVSDTTVKSEKYFYNDTSLAEYLTEFNNLPIRIGYDFVGWGFSYVHSKGVYSDLADTVNTESQVLYLCKELLAKYEILKTIDVADASQSTILMLEGNLLPNNTDFSWVLNGEQKGETYGDEEDKDKRYVYIFPIWKAQTFSVNISLNIAKEELKNLYEKDSSFALGLYSSSGGVYDYNKFTGISSKYYTYDTERKATNSTLDSYYPYYYNDIVANICFEVEFDTSMEDARMSFGGKSYQLKDLFATSAGYYFLGLMTKQLDANEEVEDDDYYVRNTLKSYLKLDEGLVSGEIDGESEYVEGEFDLDGEDQKLILDYDHYLSKYYVTYHDDDNITGNKTNSVMLKTVDYDDNKLVNSSNFGSLTFGSAYNYAKSHTKSQTFKISSEYFNAQYYLYVLSNNVKYYVVYYELGSGNEIKNVITSDRTNLYYNEKDSSGAVLNRYKISFDSNGKAYYVSNGFKNRKEVNLKVALYSSRTNSLLLRYENNVAKLVEYDNISSKNGSLLTTGLNVRGNLIATHGSGATLKNYKTREITLYAHWEIKEVTTEIINGNNSNGSYESNYGLAGRYEMNYTSELDDTYGNYITEKTSDTNNVGNKESKIEITDQFYYTNSFSILPFYNGRYISELTFEFDSMNEENSGGNTSNFSMKHNTLRIRFKWNNETFMVEILEMYLNDLIISSGYEVQTVSNSGIKENINRLSISELSLIDKFGLSGRSYTNDSTATASAMHLTERTSSNVNGRVDVNKLYFTLNNIMTSVKITCKFAVQTFNVEVYDVTSNENLSNVGTSYQTSYVSLDAMLKTTIYSYISKNAYSNEIMSTISADCSTGKNSVKEYNIPYGYIPADSELGSVTAPSSNAYDGWSYLYNYCYTNGNSSNIISRYNSNYALKSIKGNGKSLGSYDFKGWFTYKGVSNGYVVLEKYNVNQTAVDRNTTIYGYFKNTDNSTRVLFYYWDGDETSGKYVQIQDEAIVNSYVTGGSNLSVSGNTAKITRLPDPSIADWCGGKDTTKQFVGYIYLTNEIVTQLKTISSTIDYYNSSEQRASTHYKSTSSEIWSAIYNNKAVIKSTNTLYTVNSGESNADLIREAIEGLSKVSFMRYRIQVCDNTYYLKQSGDSDTSILEGIRASIGVNLTVDGSETGRFDVYKDLKMLTTDTELPTGEDIYAIPIYDEMKLDIVGVNARKNTVNEENTFTITNDSNMIESNVFRTTSNYTYYYSPNNLKFAVIDGNVKITKQLLEDSSFTGTKYDFATIVKTRGNGYIDGMSTEQKESLVTQKIATWSNNKFEDGFTIVAYYENSNGVIVMVSNSVYISTSTDTSEKSYGNRNYLKLTSSNGKEVVPNAKVDIYDSPIDVELTTENQLRYERSCDIIDAGVPDNSENREDEIINRKLITLISLQLSQIGSSFDYTDLNDKYTLLADSVPGQRVYYFASNYDNSSFTADPTNPTTSYINIENCIDLFNQYAYGIQDSSKKVMINTMGFYRLVYSLTYYYLKKEATIHKTDLGFGIETLYADNDDGDSFSMDMFSDDKRFDTELTRTSRSKMDPVKEDILPGDFLKDDRSGRYYNVIDPLDNSNNSRVYFTQTDINMGMYLGDDYSSVYLCAGPKLLTCSVEAFNEQEYQNTYATRHFVAGKTSGKKGSDLDSLEVTVENSVNGIVYNANASNTYYGLNMGIIYDYNDVPFSMGHDENLKDVISVYDEEATYVYTYGAPTGLASSVEYIKKYDWFGGYNAYEFEKTTFSNIYKATFTSFKTSTISYLDNNGYYYGSYTYMNGGTKTTIYIYEGYSTLYAKLSAEIQLTDYETDALSALESDATSYGSKYASDKRRYNAEVSAGKWPTYPTKPTAPSSSSYYDDEGNFNQSAYDAAYTAYLSKLDYYYNTEIPNYNAKYQKRIDDYNTAYDNYGAYLETYAEEGKNSYINSMKDAYLAQYRLRKLAEMMGNYTKYAPNYTETPSHRKTFAGHLSYEYSSDIDTAYFEIYNSTAGNYKKKIDWSTTDNDLDWLTAIPTKYYNSSIVYIELPVKMTREASWSEYTSYYDDDGYNFTGLYVYTSYSDSGFFVQNKTEAYVREWLARYPNGRVVLNYANNGNVRTIRYGSLTKTSSYISATVVSGYDLNYVKFKQNGSFDFYYWIIAKENESSANPKLYTKYHNIFGRTT